MVEISVQDVSGFQPCQMHSGDTKTLSSDLAHRIIRSYVVDIRTAMEL